MVLNFLEEISFIKIEECAFNEAQRIFPCEKELIKQIPIDRIISYFQQNIIISDRPFIIRTVGQAGSGKSTQLIPALQDALKDHQYIHINVGMFAKFHPNYEELQRNEPHKMREKTNGFALRSLILFYKHCVLNRVNILLDMTLLEPAIEIYLMSLAKKMGYQVQMHLLCVPKKISDSFIRLRQVQTGRHVWPSSATYFFNALAPALKTLTRSGMFCQADRLILWTHDMFCPIKQTHLNNPYVLNVLQKYQGAHFQIKKRGSLLKSKKKWMKLFVEKLDV